MTAPKNQQTERNGYSDSLNRIWGMLKIVFVTVIAFAGLTYLQDTKEDYEKKKNRPIILVSGGELKTEKEKEVLYSSLTASEPNCESNDICKNIKEYVGQLQNKPFKDEKEIIEELNKKIDFQKEQKEKELDSDTSKLPRYDSLYSDTTLMKDGKIDESALKTKLIDIQGCKKGTVPIEKQRDCMEAIMAHSRNKEKEIDIALLVENLRNYQKRKVEERFRSNESDAVSKREFVRNKVKSNLETVLKDSKYQPNFPLAGIYDDKRGTSVIYKVIQLSCIAVLVFTVLFLILCVIQSLPPFAGRTDTIVEKAKSFLESRGVESAAVAKSLVISITALGIGTAIVVGDGLKVINGDRNSKEADLPSANSQTNRLNPLSSSQPTPIQIELPVVTPSPITVQATVDPNLLKATIEPNQFGPLEGAITKAFQQAIPKIDNFPTTLGEAINTKLGFKTNDNAHPQPSPTPSTLFGQLIALNQNLANVKSAISTPKEKESNLFGEVSGINTALKPISAVKTISEEIEKTNKTLGNNEEGKKDSLLTIAEDIRENTISFPTPVNRGNFFTRIFNGFKSNNHKVSNGSYLALREYLCVVNDRECKGENKELVEVLDEMISCVPASEDEFLKALKQNLLNKLNNPSDKSQSDMVTPTSQCVCSVNNQDNKFKPNPTIKEKIDVLLKNWKDLILAYTRLPN